MTQSKRPRGQCLYIKKWELEDTEEMKKEKDKSRFRYMTETPDELCLKAKATGKLTFVTLANSPRKN